MNNDDEIYLTNFFEALRHGHLRPDDDFYVPLYDCEDAMGTDPVRMLLRGIKWNKTGEGVQLLSGFRGCGKSTELRRLERDLCEQDYLVVVCDVRKYMNLSTPIDVSDFLMVLAGALSDAVEHPDFLGSSPSRESYWERFVNFLKDTHVNVEELKLRAGAADLKLSIKEDPSFKSRLQSAMAGHLGRLVDDVKEYVRGIVGALRKIHGETKELVLLVDSLEQLRGTSINAEEVHRSVETLFGGHADKLHLPLVHVVYTVPPYLKVNYNNLGSLYNPGGLVLVPSVKTRNQDGSPNQAGMDLMARVVESRGDWQRILGDRDALNVLIRNSGGHLRDLFHLVRELLRLADNLPESEETVEAAVHQVRNGFLPIASVDAVWLHQVSKTHKAELTAGEQLPNLARFWDTHMILCYKNGKEWYDVHPLIASEVEEQALLAESPTKRQERQE